VRLQGQPCSACGWRRRPKGVAVEVIDGDLAPVTREWHQAQPFDADHKQLFYRQLLFIADEKRFDRGWAAHKFREKFGAWPPRGYAEPMPPDASVRSWVKSRQIAWAKAQEKQRAATP
jgi:DNA repair protein RadD